MADIYLVLAQGSVGAPLLGPFPDEASAREKAEAIVREDGPITTGRCVVIGPVPGFVVGDDVEE